MTLVARHAALSDIGLHRATNEDSFKVEGSLFVIADGMGGAQAGEVASRTAVDAVVELVAGGTSPAEAAAEANRTIHDLAGEDESRKGMGTTLTALSIAGRSAVVAHIGDSRLYRLRDGTLEQLTDDHSMVGQWLREGTITPEEAAVSRYRSVLTRALGTEPTASIDAFEIDVRADDRFLLSTDGLHGLVSAELLADILAQGPPEVVARELVREAKNSGGYDNVTVIVVRIDELDAGERGKAAATASAAAAATASAAAATAAPAAARGESTPSPAEPRGHSVPRSGGDSVDDGAAPIASATTPSVMAGVVQAPAAAVRSRRRHRLLVAGLVVALGVLVVAVLVITGVVDPGSLWDDDTSPAPVASPALSASPQATPSPALQVPADETTSSPAATPEVAP